MITSWQAKKLKIMTLTTRRIIYISMIVVFLIAVPAISLYFSGYRYDFKKQKFARIGAIELQSKTIKDGANIYLNNEQLKKELEEKLWLDNIFPGQYNLKIEKEGYYTCEKEIEVKSSLTTFISNIILFKKTDPEIIDENIVSYFYSPDNSSILFTKKENNNYQIYNLNTKNKSINLLIPLLTHNPKKIDWSSDNKRLIVSFDQAPDFYIFDIDNKNGYFLSEFINIFFDQLIWADNENRLFGIQGKKLFEIDLFQIIYEKILNFPDTVIGSTYFLENNLYWTTSDNKYSYIYFTDLENLECEPQITTACNLVPRTVTNIKKTSNYEFINDGTDIVFYDKQNKILYIIDPDESIDPIKDSINDIENLIWKNNKILYWNEFEIWTYENRNKNLIERLSSPISEVVWYPDQNSILYVSDNKLIIKEIKQNETCNNYELVQDDLIKNILINEKGDYLYFYGVINNIEGLYHYSLL